MDASWLIIGYVILSVVCIFIVGGLLRRQENKFPDLYLGDEKENTALHSVNESLRNMLKVMQSDTPVNTKLVALKKYSDTLVQILKTFTTL